MAGAGRGPRAAGVRVALAAGVALLAVGVAAAANPHAPRKVIIPAVQAKVKAINKQLRERTIAELNAYGYETIPSDTNFFMVNTKTDVTPLGQKFAEKYVLVGRKFPPMDTWLRVSIGTDEEMKRFTAAFKEILPAGKPASSAAAGV